VTAAVVLTLVLSHGVDARTTFQSSPVLPTPVTPAPFDPALTPPPPGLTAQPFASPEPPTSAPEPPYGGPTPTVTGFLPAPTIVNPNDLGSLPLAQPAITNLESAPEPTPPTPANDDPSLRAGLALINLVWLICGGSLLIGGAVAILLLLRRSGRL